MQKKGVCEHFQEISRPPSSTVTLTRFLHFYAPFFGTKGLTNTLSLLNYYTRLKKDKHVKKTIIVIKNLIAEAQQMLDVDDEGTEEPNSDEE